MTTKLAEPFVAMSWSGRVESPAKLAVRVYVAACSPGVMGHVAVPVPSVMAEQVSVPLREKVTFSPGMTALVTVSVSTPETSV